MSIVFVHTREWSHKNGPDSCHLVLQICQLNLTTTLSLIHPRPPRAVLLVRHRMKRKPRFLGTPNALTPFTFGQSLVFFSLCPKQIRNGVLTFCCAAQGEASNYVAQRWEIGAIERDILETSPRKLHASQHRMNVARCLLRYALMAVAGGVSHRGLSVWPTTFRNEHEL